MFLLFCICVEYVSLLLFLMGEPPASPSLYSGSAPCSPITPSPHPGRFPGLQCQFYSGVPIQSDFKYNIFHGSISIAQEHDNEWNNPHHPPWAGEGATGEPGTPSEARRGGFPRKKKKVTLTLHLNVIYFKKEVTICNQMINTDTHQYINGLCGF